MGLGMSLNLQKYLQSNNLSPLRYSNRTLSKGDLLRDEGAIPEEKFEDVVRNSDVIFTMVGGTFVCYRTCAVLTKKVDLQ
jgi:3-hydroxyisobutyrate dehydrogenase-like beta-hydroxyacid dehydrogenase